MQFSELHLQFFRLLDRLKKIDWSAQFVTLKPAEFLALKVVSDHHAGHPELPGIYVSAFAEEMGVAAPAASKLLRHLEEAGWITRQVDPNNRRNTFIAITSAGSALLEEEESHCAAMGQRLFDRMGQENTTRLLKAVDQIVTLLEEETSRKE